LKNGGEIGPTKNGEAREAILTERLSELLKPLQTDAEGPLVFPEMMRVPSDRRSYSKIFNTALRIAGIEVGERNLVPHSFRHTLNTLLRHEFGEDSLVMKLFGHKSSAMTDNYYNPSSAETSRFFSKHKDTINGLFSFKSKTSPGHHQSLEVAS
jgi:integrase